MPDDTPNRESLLETARELENDLSGTDDPQEQASLRQAIEFLHWIASALDHEKDHHMPIIPVHHAITINLRSFSPSIGAIYRYSIRYSQDAEPITGDRCFRDMSLPNQPEAVYGLLRDLRDAARNLNGTERASYPERMHAWLIASQYELETLCALLGG